MTNNMSTHFLNRIFVLSVFLLFFIFPGKVFGAYLSVSSRDMLNAGDTAIIDVYLHTEGETVNSIDGALMLGDGIDGNFLLRDFSFTNSVFTLWPRKPSLETGNKIYFVGGIPGGISGDRLPLFQIIVEINEAGEFKIKPTGVKIYLNDGLGTSMPVVDKVLSINVGGYTGEIKDSWRDLVARDNTAPKPFTIELFSDPNLFDGKKFIRFETTDDLSGISRYEVKEGNYPPARSGNEYVLINQEIQERIVVTAFDKAGNFQVAVLKGEKELNWEGIIMAVLFVSFFYLVYKVLRKLFKKLLARKDEI